MATIAYFQKKGKKITLENLEGQESYSYSGVKSEIRKGDNRILSLGGRN